jgi:hypothetical protein
MAEDLPDGKAAPLATSQNEPMDLMHLLDRIEAAAAGADPVSAGAVVDAVGHRSFGALLLVPGLVTLAPLIGDIPGVPTLMGLLVLLVSVQLVIGRRRFWLPQWMLRRSVAQDKVCKVIKWLRPVARFLDRISQPRLTVLTRGAGAYAVALSCIAIAAALPPMEFVPFSANGAGAALTLFGLGLIAQDGLLALIGLLVTGATFAAVLYGVMG